MKSYDELVSVVIPSYNSVSTLSETVESVINQTYSNIEIIVVDDGSTDGSAELAEALSRLHHSIRVIHQSNQGPASARNKGISSAGGKYVSPIDSDDIWHPTKVEKQLDKLKSAGDKFAFVYSPSRLIDKRSDIIRTFPCHYVHGCASNQLCFFNFTLNGSSILFKKEFGKQVGFYNDDPRVMGREDHMLAIELAVKHKITCQPEYLVGYRASETSVSSNPYRMYYAGSEMFKQLSDRIPVSKNVLKLSENRAKLQIFYNAVRKQEDYLNGIRFLLSSIFTDFSFTIGALFNANQGEGRESEHSNFYFNDTIDKNPIRQKSHMFRRLSQLRCLDDAVDKDDMHS